MLAETVVKQSGKILLTLSHTVYHWTSSAHLIRNDAQNLVPNRTKTELRLLFLLWSKLLAT
jgi:hypothetical protein